MPHVVFSGVSRRIAALTTLPLLLALGILPRDVRAQASGTVGGSVTVGSGAPPAPPAPALPAPAPPAPAPPAPIPPTPAAASVPPTPAAAPAPVAPAPVEGAPAAAPPVVAGAGGPPAVAPVVEETDEARMEKAIEKEWADRDRKLQEMMTLSGGVGLLHTQHAQGGAPGQFRLGFTPDYFSASFLCTQTFPCREPRSGRLVAGDTLNHIGATLSLGMTFAKLWGGAFEGYVTTTASANSSDVNRPSLLQVLGDTTFGVKAYGPVAKALHAGLFVEMMLVNGTGSVGLDGAGTSARFGPAFTVDLRELESRTPVRVSANLSYSVDNRGAVVTSTEQTRGTPITRIERFGLGISRVDHLDFRLGGEFFAAHEQVRPFLEYGLAIPINRQNYFCRLNNPSRDQCLANSPFASSSLTIGSRFLPWKNGFSLLAALDIGVTGVATFLEETVPTPPWTLYFGAGWAIDTRDRPPVVKTRTIEKLVDVGVAARGRVKGLVHEKDKTNGIPNAIVAYDGHPEITSMATGSDGRFTTQELSEGPYKFAVSADGYRDGVCDATVPRGGQDAQTDCALEALPRAGTVSGKVRDAETHDPVPRASVRLSSAGKELQLMADASGNFRFENVPPGTVTLTVEADNYLAGVQSGDVTGRQDNTIDALLRHRPKDPLVNVGKTEISIKQQVQFATDSSVILPASFPLLTEVADVFIKNARLRRVEIQGHTDSTGTADRNKSLSEERASAVRAWLIAHGVSPDRLVARGYGQEKPLAPNVTTATKARNRRVQFVILEQDSVGPAKAGAGASKADGKKALPPSPTY